MCLTATRAPGLLIGAPLFAEYLMQWRERGGNVRAFFRPHLFLLALVPVGLLAYMFYLYLLRGDFSADARSGQRLGKRSLCPGNHFSGRTVFFLCRTFRFTRPSSARRSS